MLTLYSVNDVDTSIGRMAVVNDSIGDKKKAELLKLLKRSDEEIAKTPGHTLDDMLKEADTIIERGEPTS